MPQHNFKINFCCRKLRQFPFRNRLFDVVCVLDANLRVYGTLGKANPYSVTKRSTKAGFVAHHISPNKISKIGYR
jgi:hypothetical protein